MHADLEIRPISPENPLKVGRRIKEQVLPLNPIKASDADHDNMMDEANRREDFDFEEDFVMEDEESNDESCSENGRIPCKARLWMLNTTLSGLSV